MREESWRYRLLRRLGFIKSYEVSKKEICKQAQSVCNKQCSSCAWHEEGGSDED